MTNFFGGLKKAVDNEIGIINNSMNVLKQWSNKNTFNILFDSDIDGDGSNNVLRDKVFNKSNLYFITFDTNNNIFGGYVSVNINKDGYIDDNNAFVFSFIRDGNVNNTKYPIKYNYSMYAYYLHNVDQCGCLCLFGNDIRLKPIGDNTSYCQCYAYNYNNEQNPLIDTTHSTKFEAKRIIVIEMN